MTKEFREYVTKILKNNGIDENVEFETSDENFGTLKWESGTMYEDSGNSLACGDIAWILEESDIRKIPKFKKINFYEAIDAMVKDDKNIYTDWDEFLKVTCEIRDDGHKIDFILNKGCHMSFKRIYKKQFYRRIV